MRGLLTGLQIDVSYWPQFVSKKAARATKNLDAGVLKSVRIRHLDGASMWKYFD